LKKILKNYSTLGNIVKKNLIPR